MWVLFQIWSLSMLFKHKLLQTLKWVLIYNIPVCLFVIGSLPSVGDPLSVLVFALFLTVMILSGPLALLYVIDARPNLEFSTFFIVYAIFLVLPFILYIYWFKSKDSPEPFLHSALILWVINGGIIAFTTMIMSI